MDGLTDAGREGLRTIVQDLIGSSERIVRHLSEMPLPGNHSRFCFTCASLASYGITFVKDGEEVAWLVTCETHKDVPVRIEVNLW